METFYRDYDINDESRMQAIFSSIFIVQNRLQTACEKHQEELTMKQWLLLAMASSSEEPANLSDLGRFMGCSRQNIRRLSDSLQKMGYIEYLKGPQNSVLVKIDKERTEKLERIMEDRNSAILKALFSHLSTTEIRSLFHLYEKLYRGLKEVEEMESHGK